MAALSSRETTILQIQWERKSIEAERTNSVVVTALLETNFEAVKANSEVKTSEAATGNFEAATANFEAASAN